MAVITLSRQFNSGGDEVASRLCDVLGYRSFDKRQILQAVEETTYPHYLAIDYSEDRYEMQTFLDRLFGQTASPVQKVAWEENPSIATRPEFATVDEAVVISLVKRAVRAAYEAGNMVIVGRGGQVLLKGMPGVLHVRIEAPVEERIQRVKDQIRREQGNGRSDAELLRAAADLVANRDVSSADYIKRYYNIDWSDPEQYHMVINLGRLSVEQAVQAIVAVVHTL